MAKGPHSSLVCSRCHSGEAEQLALRVKSLQQGIHAQMTEVMALMDNALDSLALAPGSTNPDTAALGQAPSPGNLS